MEAIFSAYLNLPSSAIADQQHRDADREPIALHS